MTVNMQEVIEILDDILAEKVIDIDSDLYIKIIELEKRIEAEFQPCAWCKELVEVDENFCYGCNTVVCVTCGNERDHSLKGLHGLPLTNQE